ncbi:hypothetical protein P8452_51886 [Trifolium repens]|nr:hypothetical protein P8452_51886 [Trifolium repens]
MCYLGAVNYFAGIERAMCRLSCWGAWVNDFMGLVLLFYAHYVFDKMLQSTIRGGLELGLLLKDLLARIYQLLR